MTDSAHVHGADVIVTGIRLPGDIDGAGLIVRLRVDDGTKHKPIIVVTACAMDTDRKRAENAGCEVFLPKPCLPEDLFAHVTRLLAPSNAPRARAAAANPQAKRLHADATRLVNDSADIAADDGTTK
jgi:two-component system, cell cycle response regulator DivK